MAGKGCWMSDKAGWKLITASVLFGAIGTLSALLRNQGVSSLVQSSFRTFGTAAALLAYFLATGRKPVWPGRHAAYFLAYGLFAFVGMFIGYTSSVAMGTPIAITTLLVNLQPVYVLAMAAFLLKEKVDATKTIPVAISIAGVAILVGGWNIQGEVNVSGALFAVMNGLCYALYLYMTKRLRASSGMSAEDILFWGYAGASVSMPLVLAVMPLAVRDPALSSLRFDLTLSVALYLAGLTLCCTLLPYLLITQSLGQVELSKASLSLVMEPVSAIMISWLVLGERIYAFHIFGGALILIAVVMVNLPRETLLRFMGITRKINSNGGENGR